MRLLDLTLPTPAENLALDEALIEEAEDGGLPVETLRFWEPSGPMVVVGRSSRLEEEVRLDACREIGVPVFRRVSGGAAVVTGPGCLMYALVLSYRLRPALRLIDHAHQFVMGTMAAALERLVPGIGPQGISDLAVGGRKVSGNSVRCKRDHLLYHGTLLYDFPLDLVERCLKMPPRQPAYREGREHQAFVANLPLSSLEIRRAIARAWQADEPGLQWPCQRTAQLVAQRYSQPEWNA
ncbi:MAG: lipoate--protein ligase family protein [Pirellulales bacterium]|nr:lipoate--protein ligase family protein [Pirellulales bacterium]